MLADKAGNAGPERRPSPHWRTPARLWSLLALLLGLALSLLVQNQQWRREQAEQWSVRTELANKVYSGMQGQLQLLETLMRATQSLYLASDSVTPDEFADFYFNMRPGERFPALLALAYAPRTQRADGAHYIIQLTEPKKGNAILIGLDEAGQKENLAGLLQARDSDQVTMSAPFRLVQPGKGTGSDMGVTLSLPVFSPGAMPRTIEERRAREQGTVSASFRLSTLIEGTLPEGLTGVLRLRVSDVTRSTPQLVYDSAPGSATPDAAGPRYGRTLVHGGRKWDVAMYPLAARVDAWHWATLQAGTLASLLLAMLVYAIVGTRHRALELGWRMSRRYRESEERFRALNERLPALVLLASSDDGRIVYANQAARSRFGAGVTGHRLAELFKDAQPEALAGGGAAGEQVEAGLIDETGAPFWANVAITHVATNGSDKLLMVAGDISEQRRLTERLSYQASHDALTELYNRHEFEHRLRAALAAAGPDMQAVLLYVDLDQFKLINDTSGHLAGDQLLVQLSAVMRRQLRDNDVLARLGGDEFGILAFGMVNQSTAEQMAERLRRSIDGYVFTWEQRSYLVSASIGGVLVDCPKVQVKDLLSQADAACYLAKERGRNRVHFHSEGDGEAQRRRGEMEWAQRLQWAVDEGLLLLAYQEIKPAKPSADDGVCVELLLRYRDENGALLPPGVFLPAAERYGLMPTIDRWVVQVALANFGRLHPIGAELRMVSINLSGASIEDAALADQIVDWLGFYQVDPKRVCFEITETVAVRNLAAVVRCMGRLRAVGCRIALDDFGAGMSSFTYLKNLPADAIKIDGSFVRDMLTDPVSRLMVRAVTDIAHQLGLTVVAEWVTDEATVQALAELGINALQGYAVHRPELTLFHRA
ncbi:bifunctional diguanylate cyclase/phosphodiesterase [Rhodanobacter hydrolyticus]|uniref:EAL domain-containing protein n=1 Tax=Rhodanobacter hydrolyticus TaxID=2250595 RepID=A0ABW8J7Q9_9GAMM